MFFEIEKGLGVATNSEIYNHNIPENLINLQNAAAQLFSGVALFNPIGMAHIGNIVTSPSFLNINLGFHF